MNIFDGTEMYKWAEDLFPICRSVAGPGNLETLGYIKKIIPNLEIHGFKSGTSVYDWEIPKEWHIHAAWIKDEDGNEIINFEDHNLHVLNYSQSVDDLITYDELDKHLFSIPEKENAIPYVTSYYSKSWGFCIEDSKRKKLDSNKKFHVYIDSKFVDGEMSYGEYYVKGKSNKEIFLSTYICHPSMANNELSGPIVTTALAREISKRDNFYSYRFVFLPETIGSIAYISSNIRRMKKDIIAGFMVTCVGDNKDLSYLPSRDGNTLSDKAALHVLKNIDANFKKYKWIHRGSDERQYCAPGVDLPIASIIRSKYGEYPEYHTSEDDLNFISRDGLQESADIFLKAIQAIENNSILRSNFICEPMLGKRGMYPSNSTLETQKEVQVMMDLISYADGTNDLIDIANLIEQPVWDLYELVNKLLDNKILQEII